MDWLAILSGFGVGAIVGMTGVGGGSLMTPLLIGVFRLNPAVAIGTDLFFASITKTSGAIAHARHGHIDRRIVTLLLTGSLPAAVATFATMHATGITKAWASTLTFSLGIALLLPALTVAAGALLGVLVSLSSVGAGAIGVTLILILYPRLSTQRLVGTDIAHAVPLTLVAGIGHWTLGHIDWALLGALLIGSLPGIWIGANLTKLMPEKLTRGLLCLSLVTAGLKVIH